MARSERGLRVKRRLQGVGFLVVVALLLGLTIAVYNKALPWQATDEVILEADRAGNQLVVPADVKLDGVLVGRVAGVSTTGDTVRMRLQLDRTRIKQIPANVEARILPKTLFGEKFVDLVIPPSGAQGTLKAGDVISQDRSETAIELQTVFNDLVPLLRTLNPAELSITLSNLADALRNRGDALGRNLQLVNTYFTEFNKELPTFTHDISALADVASTYADATPDLLEMLRNFSTNARTFSVKKDIYAQFLVGTSEFANTASSVFGRNADRLIRLAKVSEPVLGLYSKFSKVLECLPNGLAIYDRTRLEQTFGQGPFLHISLTPVGNRGRYTVDERPKKSDITDLQVPPNCYGLPYGNHGLHPVNSRFPGDQPKDNYACGGYNAPPTCPDFNPSASSTPTSSSAGKRKSASSLLPELSSNTGNDVVGSPEEQELVKQLLDPLLGDDDTEVSGGLADLLLGPMLRGMAVSFS
jgi:phospholipid/cholesterol/gamma-HCH transport system substrate-binding protein